MPNTPQPEILLIEDNPLDADLTIRALRKADFQNNILRLENGVEALDFLFHRGRFATSGLTEYPRVILLDVKLPLVGGLEVLQEIRSHKETQKIPVVMMTSSREEADIRNAYHFGANSYVVKPLSYESFQEAVSQLGTYWLRLNQPPTHFSPAPEAGTPPVAS
jgi:two-component system, response regulator